MAEFTHSEEFGADITALVKDVSLPVGYEVTDCHAMFDRDASGSITEQEFVEGMGRLIFSNEFQRSCMVQSSIADVLVEMKAVEQRLLLRIGELESTLDRGHSLKGMASRPRADGKDLPSSLAPAAE